MDNKFGKVSRISACAALKDGKTILEDLSFTAPYKIMMPFEKENGGIQIMPLCASAGIMAGDSQEFSYHVKEGADLEVLSQSFEKIHKMDEGSAARTIEVQVDKNATLYYYPQPVIPFAQSAFAVFTACESAAIREPASAGRPLAAAGGGTMGTGF